MPKKKIVYPAWKKIVWRYVRTFLATFLSLLAASIAAADLADFPALGSVLVAALSGALVATAKAVREHIASEDFENWIHRLPL